MPDQPSNETPLTAADVFGRQQLHASGADADRETIVARLANPAICPRSSSSAFTSLLARVLSCHDAGLLAALRIANLSVVLEAMTVMQSLATMPDDAIRLAVSVLGTPGVPAVQIGAITPEDRADLQAGWARTPATEVLVPVVVPNQLVLAVDAAHFVDPATTVWVYPGSGGTIRVERPTLADADTSRTSFRDWLGRTDDSWCRPGVLGEYNVYAVFQIAITLGISEGPFSLFMHQWHHRSVFVNVLYDIDLELVHLAAGTRQAYWLGVVAEYAAQTQPSQFLHELGSASPIEIVGRSIPERPVRFERRFAHEIVSWYESRCASLGSLTPVDYHVTHPLDEWCRRMIADTAASVVVSLIADYLDSQPLMLVRLGTVITPLCAVCCTVAEFLDLVAAVSCQFQHVRSRSPVAVAYVTNRVTLDLARSIVNYDGADSMLRAPRERAPRERGDTRLMLADMIREAESIDRVGGALSRMRHLPEVQPGTPRRVADQGRPRVGAAPDRLAAAHPTAAEILAVPELVTRVRDWNISGERRIC